MSRMSAYLVMAQNPGPSGTSCQCTGSLARSHAYWSHGWPWANDDAETRSITGAVAVLIPGALTRWPPPCQPPGTGRSADDGHDRAAGAGAGAAGRGAGLVVAGGVPRRTDSRAGRAAG